jgi:hypothetical protein
MTQRREQVAERERTVEEAGLEWRGVDAIATTPRPAHAPPAEAERAARANLRAQIAKLENELSQILADRFPFIAAPPAFPEPRPAPSAGPCLQGLGQLERARDRLATRVQELRARAARRSEHERNAAELLEKMRLEPGRYKYYRVPVRDLGQSGCGVYEVRPRLGLIGMLAGWWELTLSSGCP